LVYKEGEYSWVVDVFDDYFIYEQGSDLYKQTYEVDAEEVMLSGIAQTVQRVVTYEVVLGNEDKKNKENDLMTKKDEKKAELVQSIIDNESTQWTKEDIEFLNGLEEDQLEKMVPLKTEEPETKEPKVETPVANTNTEMKETTKEIKPKNMDEYLKEMPVELQNTIRESLARDEEEKGKLIGVIKANERNVFSDDFLQNKSLQELRGMACLAAPEKEEETVQMFNFQGQGDPAEVDADVPVLDLPVLNFQKTG
jgi:hypothetical protein